jgi:uncharacterized YccA/Bax inhibitor family protein
MVHMASSNPAMNDKIFQRETAAARAGGSFSPQWNDSPASELPSSMLPPPPPPPAGTAYDPSITHGYTSQGQTNYGPPPTGTPVGYQTMRVSGSLSAAAILLGILIVGGWFGWQAVSVTTKFDETTLRTVRTFSVPPWLIGAWIVGFVLAMVTIFKPKLARVTGPLYAVAEGLLVGGISHMYDAEYKGIVLQAVGLTIGVFITMLVLYATKAIRVTDKLRTGIIAATGAVMLVYLVDIVLRLAHHSVGFLHSAGPLGIGISLLIVGIAAFNLLLDFDFIDRGVRMGAPRYMEWYAGFGLVVTLVWLYLELLRLLSKLRSR